MKMCTSFFFQAEDGIRDLVRSRGLGDVYKRQEFAPADQGAADREVGMAVLAGILDADDGAVGQAPVSYTHLTLPTIYSV